MGRKLSILSAVLALAFLAMIIALVLSVPIPALALVLVSSSAFVLAIISALLRRKVKQQAVHPTRRTHT